MANYSQAQVFPILSYANTFADLMVATNGLVQQNNDLAANNFVKPSGTIFLGDSSLGLQVNTAAIVAGAFQVQGTGSSAYVQNTMRVDGLVNFTNTATSLLANGQIQAYGSGTGLTVANNATVSGTLTSGTSLVTGNQTVSGTLTASANVIANNVSVTNYLNTNALTTTGLATLANTTITTGNIANISIANETVAVSNINYLIANNSFLNTALVNNITANNQVTANGLSVTGSAYVNNLTANGQFSIGGNFVINGTTVYNSNTFTLNAGSSTATNSYFNVNRGSSGTNASIRWNESGKYFDIIDVTTNTYYSITTSKTPSNITFTGSAGTSSITSNGIVSFTSNNGVITSGASNTFTISTPQDIRTSASPTFSGLTLSSALSIANGGTGASTANSALINLLPTGANSGYLLISAGSGNFYWTPIYANNIAYTINSNISGSANTIQLAIDSLASQVISNYTLVAYGNSAYAQANAAYTLAAGAYNKANNITFSSLVPSGAIAGYVLTTGGTGSYYWAAPTGGGGGTTPGTTINSTRIYPTVNAAQTLFTTPTYVPGANQLRVYLNGVRQFGSDYTETSNTSVTLGSGASAGDVVLLEVDGYINNPYYANNIAYSVNANIDSAANTIQLAIDGLTSKLVTYYANTLLATTFSNVVTVSANSQITSLGVGTSASGVSGEIRASNNITAYYSSDISLKENIQDITNAVDIVTSIGGKTFDWKDDVIAARGGADGYYVRKEDFGVIAQDVQSVFPLAVRQREDGILAVDYEKMCALAFAAIKELKAEIDMLKGNSK